MKKHEIEVAEPESGDAEGKEAIRPERLLRFPEVRSKVGLSRSTIWRKVRAGEFPAPIQIGKSTVAWLLSEIDKWIMDRVAASRVVHR